MIHNHIFTRIITRITVTDSQNHKIHNKCLITISIHLTNTSQILQYHTSHNITESFKRTNKNASKKIPHHNRASLQWPPLEPWPTPPFLLRSAPLLVVVGAPFLPRSRRREPPGRVHPPRLLAGAAGAQAAAPVGRPQVVVPLLNAPRLETERGWGWGKWEMNGERRRY
jgi:hypothetical protein